VISYGNDVGSAKAIINNWHPKKIRLFWNISLKQRILDKQEHKLEVL